PDPLLPRRRELAICVLPSLEGAEENTRIRVGVPTDREVVGREARDSAEEGEQIAGRAWVGDEPGGLPDQKGESGRSVEGLHAGGLVGADPGEEQPTEGSRPTPSSGIELAGLHGPPPAN